jgi:hypothetical protein
MMPSRRTSRNGDLAFARCRNSAMGKLLSITKWIRRAEARECGPDQVSRSGISVWRLPVEAMHLGVNNREVQAYSSQSIRGAVGDVRLRGPSALEPRPPRAVGGIAAGVFDSKVPIDRRRQEFDRRLPASLPGRDRRRGIAGRRDGVSISME